MRLVAEQETRKATAPIISSEELGSLRSENEKLRSEMATAKDTIGALTIRAEEARITSENLKKVTIIIFVFYFFSKFFYFFFFFLQTCAEATEKAAKANKAAEVAEAKYQRVKGHAEEKLKEANACM